MSQNFEKLKAKLLELFMLDQPELDFGIYRIMNSKRTEITQFLNTDLLPQVKTAFAQYTSVDKGHVESELAKAVEQAKQLGVDPETTQKVKDIRAKLAESMDLTALENEVYSDLYNFFRRYYKDGDFLSLRRYKEGVYAIPYEGEEVKLYWANHDQYYIKSSEYLRDYRFTLPNGKKVHFKLTEADIEKDNRKADANKERLFILADENFIAEENGELIIRFLYIPCEKGTSQKDLIAKAMEKILQSNGLDNWIASLSAKAPTEKNPNRILLEKHLTDYTARNTFDYFIHKDLGGFLRRELDFYIKNEIMHLDDVENETAPKVEQVISKIKVIRQIARKIIRFLEQLENFQKKLWLKKKFVVEANYCVTLDRVPEALFPEIAANDAQREEWGKLFAIDGIKAVNLGEVSYSNPLTVEFLKANLYLVLDTKYYDERFNNTLLKSFDDIENQLDGLLIHSENFQALNLMLERYRENVKCAYIDPPYNTGGDGFAYKDSYQHSSWLSFMCDRLHVCLKLLSRKGLFFSSIDFVEESVLRIVGDNAFGSDNFLAKIIWEKRFTRSNNAKLFSTLTENIIAYRKTNEVSLLKEPRNEKADSIYSNPDDDPRGDWTSVSYVNPASKEARPNLVYELHNPITKASVTHPTNAWKYEKTTYEKHVSENRLYWGQDGGHTYPRLKKFLSEMDGMVPVDLWKHDDTGTTDSASKLLEDEFGKKVFEFPKPPSLIQRILGISHFGTTDGLILDFFAGTGPTGHAVINMNRKDGGRRKYILIEMDEYFNTILKPRIQKVIYSNDWKDGKPVNRDSGISHMFKYIRLESYEDCLNNLILSRTKQQDDLLSSNKDFRESYMLGYMLDTEAANSASLLNINAFEDPFNYKLNIATGNVGETKPVVVDIVETFNYLLGLRVKHTDTIRGYRVIEGYSPKDEKVLVIWRNTKEKSNEDLEKFFVKQKYNTLDMEYDLIYVNGDNNLENLKKDEDTWKVRLIEEEFGRLMFDVQDV